jgi:alkylation response protein AidB-like acyl-CoA dehydrogenase
MSKTKMWGPEAFWGMDYDWDPQWVLTPEQEALQEKLIELCRTTLRDNAVESDRNLVFPRENFEAMASLGLLGLNVPREWGGLGENHTCTAMVVETLARYGCASTAMCYTMHIGAVAAALFRAHDNPTLQDLMKRLDEDVLVGTLSYSDPETGSHFWYPISSGAERVADGWKVRKGVVDDVRGFCRLVHRADDESGFRGGLFESVLFSRDGRRGESRAVPVGWPGAAREPVRHA